MGVFDSEMDGHLDLVFSMWQWPDTAGNIRDTGRLAVTLASPSSYASYQMKGKAWLQHAKPDDIARSDGYIEAIDAYRSVIPTIIRTGHEGIPVRDALELEIAL